MLRSPWLVPALLLACPTLRAQDPAPPDPLSQGRAEVARRLASEAPADVAWGAHLAGRLGLADLVPALRQELQDWTISWEDDAPKVRLYLVDALAVLHAELPGEELAPHLHGATLPPALVLAAADAETHGALLFALLQEHWLSGDGAVRQAAGNLLAQVRHPQFGAWLLQRLSPILHVTVRDVDPSMIGIGHHGGTGAYGGVYSRLPEAWPPVPRYRLTSQGESGSVLLAPGPTPVYYSRTEDERRTYQVSRRPQGSDPRHRVHQWLGVLARTDLERIGVPLDRFEVVHFETAEAFRDQVERWRERFTEGYTQLVRSLVIRGALTEKEAAAQTLSLRIRVEDERQDRSAPLPEVGRP